MDETNHWRQMFGRDGRAREPERNDGDGNPAGSPPPPAHGGYDDGYQPQAEGPRGDASTSPLTPGDVTDAAAMSLAEDGPEYRPWVLQRGTRPVLMLHLRRHDPKSGLWMGWEISYPHLVAVEYTGDKLLSLDFGSRQFMLEGTGLDELARHLQTGSVLMVQEYAPSVWPVQPGAQRISAIRKLDVSN